MKKTMNKNNLKTGDWRLETGDFLVSRQGSSFRYVFASIVLIFMLSVSVFAKDNAGTTVFQFLKMDTSARVMSLGGAFTAVADDVNALRYNPAGLRMLLRRQVSGTHLEWFEGIRGEYLAYGQPIGAGSAVGVSVFYVTADGIERRDIYGAPGGSDVPFSQKVIQLGWATRLDRYDNMMLGFGFKYADEIYLAIPDLSIEPGSTL